MSDDTVREDFLDYPTAWRIAKEGVKHTTDECSYVQTDGALLCDCGAVRFEWDRRIRAQEAKRRRTTHGDPFLSPSQTNPTAGTPEDAAAQLDMAGDLTFNRDEDDSGNRHTLDEVVEELGIDESDDEGEEGVWTDLPDDAEPYFDMRGDAKRYRGFTDEALAKHDADVRAGALAAIEDAALAAKPKARDFWDTEAQGWSDACRFILDLARKGFDESDDEGEA